MINMKKAVIFDVDGVIIFSERIYQKRREIFFEKNGLKLSEEEQEYFVGLNARAMFSQLIADSKKRQKLLTDYADFRDSYPIDYPKIFNPDLLSTFAALKEKNVRLAVASSGVLKNIHEILKVNQIADYFELVVSGEMFEHSKPHPQIYQHTVSQLGLLPEQCLAVEDSTFGIEAARKANVDVAALKSTQYQINQSQATYQIDSTKKILNLL